MAGSGAGAPALAQDGRPSAAPPSLGVSLGFGSVLGWLGGGLERYFSDGRASVALGVGYVPKTDEGNPSFGAFGAGTRRYFGAGSHRVALELSVSLVSFEWITQGGVVLESHRYYGPGLAGAYRYTAEGGWHFDASVGAGWAVTDRSLAPIGSLAVGHTWRR